MSTRFTETYEEWRERVGIMPDQDVREAWEYQQEKIRDLLVMIDEMSKKHNKLWEEH